MPTPRRTIETIREVQEHCCFCSVWILASYQIEDGLMHANCSSGVKSVASRARMLKQFHGISLMPMCCIMSEKSLLSADSAIDI